MNVLDKKATLTAIRSIAKSDGALKDKIQAAAIGALVHAGEHGDTGLMAKLVQAVNATTAVQLRKYFQAFAPVTFNADKGTFTKVKKGGVYRTADAMDVNWFDAIEAKKLAAKEYSADKVLANTGKALLRDMERAMESDDTITANLLADAYQALVGVNVRIAA